MRSPLVLVLALGAACGDLQGFGGPAPPLATITVETSGDLAAAVPDGVDPATVQLRAAVVWGTQGVPDFVCVMPPESAALSVVLGHGCLDPFRFTPDRVAADAPITPGVPAQIDLVSLPSSDVMVGDVTARVAYASVFLYEDMDGDGTLDLVRPPRHHDGEDPPATRDRVYGVSFQAMTLPDQRLAFREGAFITTAYYPRVGCGDPLPGFSVLRAGGFTVQAALLASLAGELPAQDPATCSEFPADEATIVVTLESLPRAVCVPREVEYEDPESVTLGLFGEVESACADVAGEDGMRQAVVAGGAADGCPFLHHYVLRGCEEDPACATPEWDRTAAVPSWWPCA